MADSGTLGAEGDNKQPVTVATSPESISDEDRKKAEELKEKANEFFKSIYICLRFFFFVRDIFLPSIDC